MKRPRLTIKPLISSRWSYTTKLWNTSGVTFCARTRQFMFINSEQQQEVNNRLVLKAWYGFGSCQISFYKFLKKLGSIGLRSCKSILKEKGETLLHIIVCFQMPCGLDSNLLWNISSFPKLALLRFWMAMFYNINSSPVLFIKDGHTFS